MYNDYMDDYRMISIEEAKEAARTLRQFCDEQKDCRKCAFRISQKAGKSSEIFHCGACYPANQDWEQEEEV